MARDFAKLLTKIWSDEDWKRLSSTDHDVYLALLTTHDLSWCGVAPMLPQRLVGFASDLTLRRVDASLRRLSDVRFILNDDDTGEIAVRSFIRNDKVMSQPNIVRAMNKALSAVRSETIIDNIECELTRVFAENPEYRGWDTLKSINEQLWELATRRVR